MKSNTASAEIESNHVAGQLTATGRGAIATVWIRGPRAGSIVDRFFQATSGQPIASTRIGDVVHGVWNHPQGMEDVIVVRPDAVSVEVHTHGGWLPPRMLLQALKQIGVREVDPESALACLVGDVWRVAATVAAHQASTLSAANRLLLNADRLLADEIGLITEMLDDPGRDHESLGRLNALRDSFAFGRRLIRGWNVVIAGRPNVGKSSLINRLVGFSRSIVFDQPGTTRDLVRQLTAIGGWPIQLCDTAGVRRSNDSIEQIGVQMAYQAVQAADLTIWVSDLSQPWTSDDQRAIDSTLDRMLIHNKADIAEPIGDRPSGISVSLLRDRSVEPILKAIELRLFAGLPAEQRSFLVSEWQVAAVISAAEHLSRGNRRSAAQALRQPVIGP